MPQKLRTTISPAEAAVVTVACFGLFILWSVRAVAAGFPSAGFTSAGFLGLIATEIVLAILAVAFLWIRGYDVATLMPQPSFWGTAHGVGLFIAAWIIGVIAVTPFATSQPEQPIYRMMSEAQLSIPLIVGVAMINGTFEEVFLLGCLVRGLRGLGISAALGIPLLIRVLYHLYQGPLGALWVLVIGLVFSLSYVRSPVLWPPVFAHILWDIVPFLH